MSTLACASDVCKQGFVFQCSNGTIDLQVPFHVLDITVKEVNYDEHSLHSDSYFVHESTQYLIPSLNMQGTNVAHITLPRPMRNNIFVSLAVVDDADHYLPFNKVFVVPGNANNVYLIQPALLLTKDGKGCVGSANTDSCFAGKLMEFNSVQVWAFDSETNAPIAGLPIQLLSGLDGSRLLVSNSTDDSGRSTFRNVANDYYTAKFPGNDVYLASKQTFPLQKPQDGMISLSIQKRSSGNTILEQYVGTDSPATDTDFNLAVLGANGNQCRITPFNKYCAYAAHLGDNPSGQSDYQKIQIY